MSEVDGQFCCLTVSGVSDYGSVQIIAGHFYLISDGRVYQEFWGSKEY